MIVQLSYWVIPVLLFIAMFIGNAQINGTDLFYSVTVALVLPVLFLLPTVKRVNVAKCELVALSSMFYLGLLILNIIFGMYSYRNGMPQYFYWPIQAWAVFIEFVLFLSFFRFENKGYLFGFLAIFLFLSLPGVWSFFFGIERYMFFFGPNTMYKVLSILALFCLYYFRGAVIASLFILSVLILSVLATGSRAGLLSLLLVIGYYLDNNGHLNYKRLSLLVVTSFGMFFLIGGVSDSRLFLLDIESSSVSIRFIPWSILMSDISSFVFSFGVPPLDWAARYGVSPPQSDLAWGSEGLQYPHNIILELIFYYGAIGSAVSCGIVIIFIRLAVKVFHTSDFEKLLYYIFTTLFVAALFSGDLKDNYAVFGLLPVISGFSVYVKSRKF